MIIIAALVLLLLALVGGCQAPVETPAAAAPDVEPAAVPAPPIIDMHLHAYSLAGFTGERTTVPALKICASDQEISFPGVDPRNRITVKAAMTCPDPRPAPRSDEELLRQTLEILERRNIWAVTSGPLEDVTRWRTAAPERIIPALDFSGSRADDVEARYVEPSTLRQWVEEGKLKMFGELGCQYRGLSPADESLEPYFALAEELDVPVGIHMGEGPPGGPHVGYPNYRARLGNPLLLEDVLVRHPKLRLCVMHYGSPMIDEMIAVLFSHPQVYVDLGGNNWMLPRKQFYDHLRRLVDAGYAKRIMFGSDAMVWPWTIEVAIETVQQADFLTDDQKRDILYDNAARFLRLSPEEIAKHKSVAR
jgi:uncharacterized protein